MIQLVRDWESCVKKVLVLPNIFANSPVRKALAREAREQAPKYYKKATSKIKNKRLCKVLNSNTANTALDLGLGYTHNNSNKCKFFFFTVIVNLGGKGISNLEIKRVIGNISNDDLKNNFVSVFVSDEINCFRTLLMWNIPS